MSEFKLAVIGTGEIYYTRWRPTIERAREHGRDVRVTAIVSTDFESAEREAAFWSHAQGRNTAELRTVEQLRDYRDDVDGVIVCVPNAYHAQVVIAALGMGFHVLCEKPPAARLREAIEMKEAADLSGCLLMYSLIYRHMARDIKKLVAERCGTLYRIDAVWKRRRGFPGGGSGGGRTVPAGREIPPPLQDLVHVWDLGWWLAGCPPLERVGCDVYHEEIPVDVGPGDEPRTLLVPTVANGQSIHASPDPQVHLRIQYDVAYATYGVDREEASILVMGFDGSVSRPLVVGDVDPQHCNVTTRYTEHGFEWTATSLSPLAIGIAEGFDRQLDHFLDCAQGNEDPIGTADEGVEIMAFLDGADQSDRDDFPVRREDIVAT